MCIRDSHSTAAWLGLVSSCEPTEREREGRGRGCCVVSCRFEIGSSPGVGVFILCYCVVEIQRRDKLLRSCFRFVVVSESKRAFCEKIIAFRRWLVVGLAFFRMRLRYGSIFYSHARTDARSIHSSERSEYSITMTHRWSSSYLSKRQRHS